MNKEYRIIILQIRFQSISIEFFNFFLSLIIFLYYIQIKFKDKKLDPSNKQIFKTFCQQILS